LGIPKFEKLSTAVRAYPKNPEKPQFPRTEVAPAGLGAKSREFGLHAPRELR
jgi:hypothetical protein